MNPLPVCVCRRQFADDGGLQRHQQTCALFTHHSQKLVERAAGMGMRGLKRRRMEELAKAENSSHVSEDMDHDAPQTEVALDVEMAGPSHPIVEEAVVPLHDAPMVVDAPAPVSSTPAGRPIRSNRNRLPARYRDMLPEGPTCDDLGEARETSPPPLPQITESVTSSSASVVASQSAPVPVTARTVPNSFGLFREYADRLPDRDPDTDLLLDDLLVSSSEDPSGDADSVPGADNPYAPYQIGRAHV